MKKILLIWASFFLSSMVVYAADKENGKRLIEVNNCAACHGADLKTPLTPEYPKIAGQHRDYLFHALLAYQAKSNSRLVGRNNAIMVGQVAKFTRKELEDMAAYIASLPGDLTVKR